MPHEEIEEELAIMEERASVPPTITADVLQRSIVRLCEHEARTLDVSATVGEAIELMQRERFGSVVVVEGGLLVGIVTERDVLMKVAGRGTEALGARVTSIMTRDPEALRSSDLLVYLMNKMHVGGFRHVPIIDAEGRPTHVVSIRDVLSYLLDHFGPSVVNVPSEPFRGVPGRDGG